MNIYPYVGRLMLTNARKLKIRFFMLSNLNVYPREKKNSLERAVAFSLCSVPLQKGTKINSQTSVRY